MQTNGVVFSTLMATLRIQHITYLSEFKGDSRPNWIFSGNTSIYATANNVDAALAQQIMIGSIAGNISLFELINMTEAKTPLLTRGLATLTTNLTTEQLKSLNGFIYVTSEKQAKVLGFVPDPSHHVYDVNKNLTIRIDLGTSENSTTVVFLNSNALASPKHATTISNWNQSSGATVQMYPDIPSDHEEREMTEIFRNPINSNEKTIFVKNVDDFTVTLPTFYMRINGTGSVSFDVSPTYYDINSTITKAVTSTGFYMKSYYEPERTVVVQVPPEPEAVGLSGFYCVSSDIPKDAVVYVFLMSSNGSYGSLLHQSKFGSRKEAGVIGYNFTISSRNVGTGTFFVQYYSILEEDSLAPEEEVNSEFEEGFSPVSREPFTLASIIESATKSANSLSIICVSILMLLVPATLA